MTKPLGQYSVPKLSINRGAISGKYKNQVEADLSSSTYNEKFQALIYVEEHQMEKDINMYTMYNASPFSCENKYYIGLKVNYFTPNVMLTMHLIVM